MESYLQQLKSLQAAESAIVLGNPTADLDSVVSALILAFYSTKSGKPAIAVINIPRSELRLRSDVTTWLKENNIDPELLCFRDDIDLHTLAAQEQLHLTLVDHNELPADDEHLEPFVDRIVDHHKTSDTLRKPADAVIELVGSCCTLVAEHSISHLDEQCARLLYGTILVDTACLDESAGRTTAKDKEIVEKLEAIMHADTSQRSEIFNKLQGFKFDLSALTVEEILSKDMKEVTSHSSRILCPSVLTSPESFFARPDVIQQLEHLLSDANAKMMVLLFIHLENGSPVRHLAIYDPEDWMKDELVSFLNRSELPLSLTPVACPASGVSLYSQAVEYSRKHVLPLLSFFLESSKTPPNSFVDPSSFHSYMRQHQLVEETVNEKLLQDTTEGSDSPPHEAESDSQVAPFEEASEVTTTKKKKGNKKKIRFATSEDECVLIAQRVVEKAIAEAVVQWKEECIQKMAKEFVDNLLQEAMRIYRSRVVEMLSAQSAALPERPRMPSERQQSEGSTNPSSPTTTTPPTTPTMVEAPAVVVEATTAEYAAVAAAAERLESGVPSEAVIVIGETQYVVNMSLITPYQSCFAHGGSTADGCAIVHLYCCRLPPKSTPDYELTMENLFHFFFSLIEKVLPDEYILIFFQTKCPRDRLPSLTRMRRAYQMIDRLLKKQLRALYMVHPTFWTRTVLTFTKPFISSKVISKLSNVSSLNQLKQLVPLDAVVLPTEIAD